MHRTKRQYFPTIIVSLSALALGLLAWRLCWPPALYQVTILPSLGGQGAMASALNDRNQVVGIEHIQHDEHLFVWDSERGIQDLGPASEGRPLTINNAGQISGAMPTAHSRNECEAFLWEPGKGRTMLGTLGEKQSFPVAMNNRGQIIGRCWSPDDPNFIWRQRSFIWDKAAGIRELDVPGSPDCQAMSINDRGQILSSGLYIDPSSTSFLLDPNGPKPLIELPSHTWFCEVNNRSCVAGRVHSEKSGFGESYLVLLDQQRTLKRLSGTWSLSEPILNDRNQIAYMEYHQRPEDWWRHKVSRRRSRVVEGVPYLWDPSRGRIALKRYTRGMRYFRIEDLNNNGCIIGVGMTKDHLSRSVLLEPIPKRWAK